MKIDNY